MLAPERMNSIVLSGEKGEKSGVCYYSGSMPVRHFYLLALILYLQWSILFIFCVLAPEGMNAIVFGGDKGKRAEVYYLFGRYFCHGILFICSYITFPIVYSFYFLFVGSRRTECNSLWEG